MTKSILKQYLDLKAEKEQIEFEIQEFYDTCVKPSILTGMPGSKRVSDPTAEFADQAARLHTKLRYKKYEMSVALEAIEDAIEGLQSRERRLMREYYINGLTWNEISQIMHYSVDYLWHLHSKAIKEICS